MSLVFYILPHQDDEIFAIPRIRNDIKAKKECVFIFLTSNSDDLSTQRRNQESLRFLKLLGVKKNNIVYLGKKFNVLDGHVYTRMSDLAACIDLIIAEKRKFFLDCNLEFVTTAFEGGHHDHDAAALVSRALSEKWLSPVFEFFLYNGYNTRGRIYKVAYPFKSEFHTDYSYQLMDIGALLLVPFWYVSQIKTMLGLWPILFLKSFFRPLALRKTEPSDLFHMEHSDVPLYERWNRITYAEFKASKLPSLLGNR